MFKLLISNNVFAENTNFCLFALLVVTRLQQFSSKYLNFMPLGRYNNTVFHLERVPLCKTHSVYPDIVQHVLITSTICIKQTDVTTVTSLIHL